MQIAASKCNISDLIWPPMHMSGVAMNTGIPRGTKPEMLKAAGNEAPESEMATKTLLLVSRSGFA